jgi:hypothetical protein
MNSNYDGSSIGKKNAEYGALDALYQVWDAAAHRTEEAIPHRPNWLPKVVALGTLGALIMAVLLWQWGPL